MASVKLVGEKPISLAELKSRLQDIETRDKELNFRGNKVKDYLNKVVKLNLDKSIELKQNLEKLDIPRIKDRQLIKIIDILPEDIEEVRALFSGETTTITQESMEKIVETVKPYLSKSKKK